MRYSSLGFKANEHCRFLYRLIPCVMACLGPEGSKNLILMRIEVTEHSISRYTVTIPVIENSFDLLSNLLKFVSLSFYCFVLETFIMIAHCLDVVFILLIS